MLSEFQAQVAGRRVALLLLGLQHLGRRVGQGAHRRVHPALAEVEAQAPVDELHVLVRHVLAAEADVLRLHVPVRDAPVVRVQERRGALPHDLRRGGLLYCVL